MEKKFLLWLIAIILHTVGYSQSPVKISKDIELYKISDNAFIHVSYTNMPGYGQIAANGLIFTNGTEAFLFDTPWNDSLTVVLVGYLSNSLKLKIVGFAPNHWHEDCMGGLGFLKNQHIESYASQNTVDIAKAKGLPVPQHAFKDSMELHLGDRRICLYYLGAAHSTDNIVVWIPSEKILFPGCMVKSMDSDNLGNTADGDLKAYPVTIDKVIEKFPDARIVIPGHGQYGGIELLKHTKDLVTIEKNP